MIYLEDVMKKVLLLLTCVVFSTGSALAEGCDTPCPTGQVSVSYSDGNHVSCACVAEASEGMLPNAITEDDMTEADAPPTVAEGGS